MDKDVIWETLTGSAFDDLTVAVGKLFSEQ